jgi:plastocyanin
MPGPKSLARQAAVALAVAAPLTGCGSMAATRSDRVPARTAAKVADNAGEPVPQRPRTGHVTVSIDDYAYLPRRLTVTSGTRITFINRDQQFHAFMRATVVVAPRRPADG